MHLHRRLNALQLHNLVLRGARVNAQLQNVVAGRVVQIAIGLHQRDQLRRAVKIIQRHHAIQVRQVQVRSHLRRHRPAVRLFFQQLRIDRRRRSLHLAHTRSCVRRRMSLLPLVRRVPIHQVVRKLFHLAALSADVAHDFALHRVAHHQLVAAVFQDQPRAMRRAPRGLRHIRQRPLRSRLRHRHGRTPRQHHHPAPPSQHPHSIHIPKFRRIYRPSRNHPTSNREPRT